MSLIQINYDFLKPVDYLLIGHITEDLVDSATRLGGTVTYSGITTKALGFSVGIVTSCKEDIDLSIYEGIQIVNRVSDATTTFRNIHTESGRDQYMYQKADIIDGSDIPLIWENTPFIHIGPIANEVDPGIINSFPNSKIFLTPQGWLRDVDTQCKIHHIPWNIPDELTSKASAIVISTEDVQGDEEQISKISSLCPLLVVTENQYGARVYWHGDVRHISAPEVDLVEDTGAGDIFAASFFAQLIKTKDPWESAKFAVKLSAVSVTKKYLESIPSKKEILDAQMEIIQ